MQVYAVKSNNSEDRQDLEATAYPNVLVSFVADPERSFLDLLRYRPERLFLDSGAYSVWSLGATVELGEYAAWALSYAPDVETTVANLDRIPGEPGRAPTRAERERSVAEGKANADDLRSRGLAVTETFHRYEPLTVLDELVERRRPGEVLAIGGLVGGSDASAKVAFCDSAFARLRDIGGGWKGLAPVHGFGVSPDVALARRYPPWFSIDSTSWFRARELPWERRLARSLPGYPKDGRLTKPMSHLYFQAMLRRWQKTESALSALWASRGVTFAE